MRSFFIASVVSCLVIGCGSDGEAPSDGAGGGGNGGSPSGTGGAGGSTTTPGTAQVRFRYEADWKDHLGACTSISDYRIKFGAIPVPISVSIVTTDGSMSEYKGLDGRLYKDDDVLHIFSCNRSQTSKDTKQEYGLLGTDLALEPDKSYTVTLGGSAATLTED